MSMFSTVVIDNIVVSMSACHADNPDSIIGRGVKAFVFIKHKKTKNILGNILSEETGAVLRSCL
jgi:hypothetical protein